jgi:hypothetical protein
VVKDNLAGWDNPVVNVVATLFGLHYLACFYAGEELVLPKHETFLVTTEGENAEG